MLCVYVVVVVEWWWSAVVESIMCRINETLVSQWDGCLVLVPGGCFVGLWICGEELVKEEEEDVVK